jgi:subfamily B ATP-binding cassette protein MsbA
VKTYFRLLTYCKPVLGYIIPYAIFTLLYIFFGLLNFSLIIPLLNVLFGTIKLDVPVTTLPDFTLSTGYLLDTFNYYFNQIITQYGRIGALKFVAVAIVISVFLSNIFRYLATVRMEFFKTHIVRNIRNSVFEKLQGMHIGYFSDKKKGDLMIRTMADSIEVESSVSSSMAVFFTNPISLVMYFITLFAYSAKLTLFTLAVIPISGLIISLLTKRLRKQATESFEAMGGLNSILEESLSAMKIINVFNAQLFTLNRFKKHNNDLTDINRKFILRKELSSPFSEFTGVLVVSFILLYGGSLVLNNSSELTASAFIVYITVFSQVLRPAKDLSTSLIVMQRGLAAGDRIIGLLDLPVEVTDKPGAVELNRFAEKIEFKNVSFSYGDKHVLRDINFTLQKGKMIALVGPSGGGKSTLADLVPRFYDPISGDILMDGHNLKDVSLYSLREQIGMVSQESILFNDTIYNNIVFGKEGATEEQVIQAAQIANAHEFILKAEHGYQTLIGDRGTKLSGGQKQRLSIARAVLRNPPILILDEATSALDTESEKLVQNALDNLMKNRTTLVIAHRLSTIQHADEILVIKDGKIVEQGSHETLLGIKGGVYSKLKNMQNE